MKSDVKAKEGSITLGTEGKRRPCKRFTVRLLRKFTGRKVLREDVRIHSPYKIGIGIHEKIIDKYKFEVWKTTG